VSSHSVCFCWKSGKFFLFTPSLFFISVLKSASSLCVFHILLVLRSRLSFWESVLMRNVEVAWLRRVYKALTWLLLLTGVWTWLSAQCNCVFLWTFWSLSCTMKEGLALWGWQWLEGMFDSEVSFARGGRRGLLLCCSVLYDYTLEEKNMLRGEPI
jgi:hypothetical protein